MAKKNIATFLGTQKGLTVLGNHCMAYSGTFNPTSSVTTFLEFTSGGKEYIVGTVEINADWAGTGGTNMVVEIYLNGIRVVFEQDVGNDYVPGDTEFKLIIPPLTTLRVDLTATTAKANANFTGRIYDA